MTISFWEFLSRLTVNPALRVTVLLILGVILVNGWTDAPNAIASLVATGGMKLKAAVRMAAVFNFAGLFIMTAFNAKVAFTIYSMVDFGGNPAKALTALCAALTAIIVWSAAAWSFGIPTSESHALIAGISGAAIALHHGTAGINRQEWIKVLYGLFFSTAAGFGLGWLFSKIMVKRPDAGRQKNQVKQPDSGGQKNQVKWPDNGRQKNQVKRKRRAERQEENVNRAQKAGAAAMAFMHGAQDGQKFMGVFLLGIFLAEGKMPEGSFRVPFWMMALCSIVMAAGTSIGGERIIKTVGTDMVALKKPQGIAADAAGAVSLFLSSLTGIPVSTTHVKTTAIMGAGMAQELSSVNMVIVKEMLLAWIITFPCCGMIGYLAAAVFMAVI